MGTSPTPETFLLDPRDVDPRTQALPAAVSRRVTLAGAASLGIAPMIARSRPVEIGTRYLSAGRSISDLTSMLGVGTVTSTLGEPWGHHPEILNALTQLGVTWIRSNIYTGNKNQVAWINQLAASGIKTNAIMGNPHQQAGTPEPLVALVASSMPTAIQSMEGANEWNLQGGSNWVSELVTHQTRLFQAAKANPVTRSIPVVGPALGRREGFVEFGNRTSIMDRGNFHLYTGGFVPGYRSDTMIANARIVCGSDPIFITETGWHNAKYSKATHHYTPEDVAGVYAPRLLLEYFIRNIPKMAIYELIDEPNDPSLTDHEAHFGLLRFNLSPKPAFDSLANLNTIMSRSYRTAGARAPLSLRFDAGPPDLRSALVARPDGRYQLYLWRGCAIYDPVKKVYLNPDAATVSVDWSATRTVRRFCPSVSATALATERTSRSVLSMKAELQVLEVDPV